MLLGARYEEGDGYGQEGSWNRGKGAAWTNAHHAELRKHSKARTPVVKISKAMKRTVGALRQQALKLGIGLGHQR